MQEPRFVRITLSDNPGDYEIIAAAPDTVNALVIAVCHKLPNCSYSFITKEEAIKELSLEHVGVGCFLHHSLDIITNENRRLRAADLLIYFAKRVGVGMIWNPVEI